MNTDNTGTEATPGLLLHLKSGSPGDIPHAVQVLANARQALPEWPLTLVIQGAAVAAARRDAVADSGLQDAFRIDNAHVAVCGNSLAGRGISSDDLAAETSTVPAAVGYLAQQQTHGWSYVRI